MLQRKQWTGLTTTLVIVLIAAAHTLQVRDAEIQSERDRSARLIKAYEQKVQKADDELKALESQRIALDDLEMISNLQEKAINTSDLLISLAPVLKNRDKVNRYSQASVDSFNKHQRAYNTNIGTYQLQMSELNRIVDRANKQYVIKAINPTYLDRASLSTRRKFPEIIGLSQTPVIAPSSQIDEINTGISERSETQISIRNKWNSKARKINETNRIVNSNLKEIYKLYKTTDKGIRIESAADVKIVD
ncbi:MAG: hypothetical protein ACK550_06135 [Synechococcaceae cyanobacterium]|jgi:hypothetical protein